MFYFFSYKKLLKSDLCSDFIIVYVGLVLDHHLRRWPNSNPTLGQRLVFAGAHTRAIQRTRHVDPILL